jgi:hypothetical protein
MLIRFALVVHWAGFLVTISVVGLFTLGVINEARTLSGQLAFMFDDPWRAGMLFSAPVAWLLRFILTGSKVLFPWSKSKEGKQ